MVTSTESPKRTARFAGAVYLLVFVAGVTSLFVRGTVGIAAVSIAGALYILVTFLFYLLFRPVSSKLSMVAACISLLGIVVGPLGMFVPAVSGLNPLIFFGVYCLLIGVLIIKSGYLPRFLGVLMLIAGCGWLTFSFPSVAKTLTPYNFIPGIVGEGALTLWLLIKGLDEQRFRQARSRA